MHIPKWRNQRQCYHWLLLIRLGCGKWKEIGCRRRKVSYWELTLLCYTYNMPVCLMSRHIRLPGHLYEQFRCQADYDNVLRYAQTLGVVLWSNARKCMFVVTEVGHQQVRAFIQKRIAQRKNGATNTLETKPYSI